MRPTSCSRLFEVEAKRYGRLGGAELASFERHLAACLVCSREAQGLDALAESLRASPPDETDELHVRRQRTRLLAAFDRTLLAPTSSWGARHRRLGLAAVAVLVAGVFVFWRVRPAAQPVPLSRGAVVRADSMARWSERTEGRQERIVLERGALWIRVDHTSDEMRLVVVLPDGELEDTGTTFTVSAEDGHTTRVSVQEGSVVLRMRDRPSVALGAGETWIPDARPAPMACASSTPPADPTPTAWRALPVRSAVPPPSSPRLGSELAPDPSVDFRAAVGALDAGKNREAATAFASFLLKHSGDPRAEDAAYLRVIALQRCGDGGTMKDAAREYLRRYPSGFRRANVETLLDDAGP